MFSTLGRLVGHMSDRSSHTLVAVGAAVAFFAAVEFIVHEVLARLALPPLTGAVLDASLVGCSFGFAVWVLLLGNRERRLRVRMELERIAELNHEIRNALQIIIDSHFDSNPTRRDMVLESVSRVDAALKRVFPVVGG